MKVRFIPEPYGAFIAEPVSQKVRRQMERYQCETGFPVGETVYFQGDWELPDSVRGNRRAMRDLDAGWDVVVLVDPWEFGHWVGWDFAEVIDA